MERDALIVTDRVWTIPNVLSFVRLGFVPLVLYLILAERDALALMALMVATLTDFLDGFLARRLNQVTRLGQVLDPAADRLFIFVTLIGLTWRDVLPLWLAVAIVLRDVVLLGVWALLAARLGGPLPVNRVGKLATFCLFYALPMIMVGQAFPEVADYTDPVAWTSAFAGTFLYWWAGVLYAQRTVRLIRRERNVTHS
ncbi:CDP-alcohol phosphatidyltransferase family protein [Planctomonas psychrotolerans]|uniref:CDP-alcohol phosphatidyltransferase family protein n=1 Tax=Planctomonas psychrotolerans TaxID=2528712 RepID=UPI00123ABF11|nr:CDP-alcohol phosphatidyltransferase family protein [Planctomonas psychrotolerans]